MIEDYYKLIPYEIRSYNFLIHRPLSEEANSIRSDFVTPELNVMHDCIFYSYIHDYYNQTCHDYRHESGA
jgi:hypothetical protein